MIAFLRTFSVAICAWTLLAAHHAPAQQRQPQPPALQPGDTVPALTVGFPAADSFEYAVAGAAFEAAVPIQAGNTGGAFAVRVSPLRSANGGVVPVTMWLDNGTARDTLGTRVRVSPMGSVDLHLRAKLPSPGTYRGAFTILTRGAPLSRTYTVAWTKRTEQPIQVTGAGAVAATVGGNDEVVIPFTLHDTSGAGALVYRPTLEELRQQVRSDTSLAVRHGAISVRVPGVERDLDNITLDPNASRELELIVPDAISGAGVYSASLRIAGPDFQPISVPLKIYARRSAGIALAIIALGILLAEAIRYLRDRVRPRLERRRRAASYLEALSQLVERVEAGRALSEEERTVIERIRARLFALYADGEGSSGADAEAELADLRRRLTLLPEWANVRRAIDDVQPRALRDDLRTRLVPVSAYLLADDARDEAALTTASTQLQAIPGEIAAAVRKHVQARVKEFLERLELERTASASDPGLPSALDGVKKELETARQLAEDGALSQAREKFDAARLLYVDLLARRLRSRLEQMMPGWMEKDGWTQIVNEVDAELKRVPVAASAEEKLRAYEYAQALYLRRAASSLETVARLLADKAKSPAEKEALSESIKAAAEAQSQAAVGDLHESEGSFRKATEAWNRYDDEREKGLGPGAEGTSTSMVGIAWAPEPLKLGTSPQTVGSLVLPVSARDFASRVSWLDFGLAVVAAALALFLGLQLLWDSDLTWGTNADMLAALLWGLGLQQAGHEIFKGVANLVGTIGGPASQGGGHATP